MRAATRNRPGQCRSMIAPGLDGAPIHRQYMHIKHIDSMGCAASFHKFNLNEKILALTLKIHAIAHNCLARFA